MVLSSQSQSNLACGVAGWSYADWRDTVYRLPEVSSAQLSLFPDLAPSRHESAPRYATDPLNYLARYLDMVEINSSFYRIPTAASTASWGKKTAFKPSFFFTAKIHQDFTHGYHRDTSLARTFRQAFQPLHEAGRLRGLLAQFRYDAMDSPTMRDHLLWLRDQFVECAPLIIEVRHVSWQHEEALDFLQSLQATVAVLDYPMSHDSFRLTRNIGAPDGYFRLHGRNYRGWFASEKEAHEPYDYDYSDLEIDDLSSTAQTMLPEVRSLTIVANNHYRGKAVSAALRLKSDLLKQRVPIPPALLDTYPALKRFASQEPGDSGPLDTETGSAF